MSQPRTWALSQDANKPNGVCSVCKAIRQLHLKDNTVHHHGPRSNPCPGSGKPPLIPPLPASGLAVHHQPSEISAGSSPSTDISVSTPVVIAGGSSFSYTRPASHLIKHIPHSARHSCCSHFSTVIRSVINSPDNLESWRNLLESAGKLLSIPPRTGKRHNLANLIKARISAFPDICTQDSKSRVKSSSHRARKDTDSRLAAAVSAKIEDGNLKSAIRLLCSDDKPAIPSAETAAKLTEKHPSAPADRRSPPVASSSQCLQASDEDVSKALKSFPAGSSGGPDGLRPQHLLDLVNCNESNGELLSSITALVNLLLSGRCSPTIAPHLFGGNLFALEKKGGGIRPIAVGFTWRRLAAKCANTFAIAKLGNSLSPLQLGVGVRGGCEAAVHATRRFISQMQPGDVLVKLDFSNAFNSLRRDDMLHAVATHIPEILHFCLLAYSSSSNLLLDNFTIVSDEGVQQGDPLGSLLFSLTLHPVLSALASKLALGYLDDVTLGGESGTVAKDVESLRSEARRIGLHLNAKKCEVIYSGNSPTHVTFKDFIHLAPEEATLLGAPLLTGPAMNVALQSRCDDLSRATGRLSKISSHDALLILRSSLSAPKVLHTLRSSPCTGHSALTSFDNLLKSAISLITNNTLPEVCWDQASLPVSEGGLGIRSVASLAPSAFLASAAGTQALQASILQRCAVSDDPSILSTLASWQAGHNCPPPSGINAAIQSQWDRAIIACIRSKVWAANTDPHNKARLHAITAPHSGDWLFALPITSCGLRLDNESIRVAVGLRLGVNICEPHPCPCGTLVNALGTHGLSCKRSAGRIARHQQLNDLVWRGLTRANIPATKEPTGLFRADGKRPDGLTLIPWKSGKCLTWDVTVADTFAASYLGTTSSCPGSAAESAAAKKIAKYTELARTHIFCPLAWESMGPANDEGLSFLFELGRRMSAVTGDPREASFLLQRISVIIQRCNAICFSGSFIPFPPSP
jgi:hypothetical protein